MSYPLFHVIHLVFLFLLVGVTASAIAAPNPERRKLMLGLSGFASLVVFVSGFMLLAAISVGFPVWIIVKIACWLGLSGLAGMAFRMPQRSGVLAGIGIVLVLIAVCMVSLNKLF